MKTSLVPFCLFALLALCICACETRQAVEVASHSSPSLFHFASDSTQLKTDTLPEMTGTIADTAIAGELIQQARIHLDSAAYEEAEGLTQAALKIYREWLGESHTAMATGYNMMTSVYGRTGRLQQGLQYAHKALNSNLHPQNRQDSLVKANTHFKIAIINRREFNFEIALENVRQTIAIQARIFGENHVGMGEKYRFIALTNVDLERYRQAILPFEKELAINLQIKGDNTFNLGNTYLNLGVVYSHLGDYNQAVAYNSRALEVYISAEERNQDGIALTYNNIGEIYREKCDYAKALDFFEKALAMRLTVFGEKHPEVAASYLNIGAVWVNKGDLDQGLAYYERAANIWEATLEPDHYHFGMVYANIGTIHQDQGNKAEAIVFYHKAIDILKKNFGETHSLLANVYNSLGTLYEEKGEFEQGLANYDKALSISESIEGGSYYEINPYMNIGTSHEKNGDYPKALGFYEKALELSISRFGSMHPSLANLYHHLGILFLKQGDYLQSWQFHQQACYSLNYDLAYPDSFSEVSNLFTLQDVLGGIESYYHSKQQLTLDPIYLDSLRGHYQTMLALEDYIQQAFTVSSTRQVYASNALPIYEGAIQNILARNIPEELPEAFILAEKTKSRQLTEHLQFSNTTGSFGIPDSLTEQEYDLDIEISYVETALFQEAYESDSPDDSLLQVYNNQLFTLRRDREELRTQLKQAYPTYHQLRYSHPTIDIQTIQQDLLPTDRHALLEYVVGDSQLFAFVILQDTFHILTLERDVPIEQWVQALRCGLLSDYAPSSLCLSDDSVSAKERYADHAYRLYQALFAQVDPLLPDQSDLLIVPDGVLGYLPFEVLLTKEADHDTEFGQYAYLLKKHTISYAYSASLQREMLNRTHRKSTRKSLLAVAPSFDKQVPSAKNNIVASRDLGNRQHLLSPLLHNSFEARNIAEKMDGLALIGEKANKASFIDQASQYQILHLSTHGKANDKAGDYAFLAFQSSLADSQVYDLLYNRELYNLDLNADLVVLSACETGIGELQRGEGIISLARGFSYAGAKSIITSLWNVNDRSTKVLMESFYSHLQSGMPKHRALRQAKLDYLSSHPDSRQSPFFWAAFIAIGDPAPLSLETDKSLWIWGLSLLILLGLGSVWRLRRNQARPSSI